MRVKLWRETEAVLFTLPALIPLLIFWLGPLGYIVYLSFTDWDFMSPDKLFVGLDNYSYLLTNSEFYRSLKVTLLFGLGSVVPTIVGGLALAMLMNSKIKSSGLFRTLLFSPWVTPTVAVSIAWSWIFEPEVGLANLLLGWVGISPIGWLKDQNWALVAVLIVTLWKSIGWSMVFYLVALRNLPSDLLEAASIDGAGSWDKFRSITLPLISPTTFFLSIILTIQSLQAYDQINVMTQGGPAGSTRTLLYMYYQSAFESFNVGEASSIAVVIILICVLLSGVSFLLGRRLVHY
ncbi:MULTISPECIES: carbohydrate ABC transporter permease [Paenibacillus]|uniref:Carbohydrate ABC transporter membrane protein 1 (CUT1 family) n=1 Tax=Paenibacillus pabuli TaxID=1472 RepID=A0A855XU28_9BACL|nr:MULTISPECIES: sugar ABC transporter permease [Paenibacillus]MCZ1264825.1 sugar ABC transporter permease [Paenibacillus tundrae]MDR9748109.1 sugar ABC transporter permease [Paenibacillus taichungensis]NEU61007.1 sugar ABC transporter permease [Paenibacillus sp. ALJ109b]OAX45874.1 Lactose transport system permease protein LacF [Paenibacillus sp. AD87]OME85472.1 ABC transporter [Paenibacillus pabuli]